MTTSVIIVGAGRGARAGGGKLYREVGNQTVMARCVGVFLEHPLITSVVVVLHPDDRTIYDSVIATHPKLLDCVDGGSSRQESVRLGLESLRAAAPDYVLIHDAARPFVSSSLIDSVLAGLSDSEAIFPSLSSPDATKLISADGFVEKDIDRNSVLLAQTPQGFDYSKILEAHHSAKSENMKDDFVDDCSLALWSGMRVQPVEGDASNFKLTYESDFINAERMFGYHTRVGHGYDVHAFGDGDSVRLCGIDIPHTHSLVGHSDADVGLHALTDALLATISAGDIGLHFPPTSEEWRDKDSGFFVEHARDLIKQAGGMIIHCDVTLVCEAPKILEHRDLMRARIAELLNLDIGCVSVKATTSEGLGFTGEGLGVASYATATVEVPRGS